MIELIKTAQVCVQSGESFACYVIVVDAEKIFSTEDAGYLKCSRTILMEDGAAIVLQCDRNSAESPDLGPCLDVSIFSPLYVQRDGRHVLFLSRNGEEKFCNLKASAEEWMAAVDVEFSKSKFE